MRIIPTWPPLSKSVLTRCGVRRRRHRRIAGRICAFDRLADFRNRSSRRIHLHRVTRDVEADFSAEAVRVPFGPAVCIAAGDETVFVSLVSVSLAPAEARHIPKNIRSPRGELVNSLNDFGRSRRVGAGGNGRQRSAVTARPRRLQRDGWCRLRLIGRRRGGRRRLGVGGRAIRRCLRGARHQRGQSHDHHEVANSFHSSLMVHRRAHIGARWGTISPCSHEIS